MPTGDNPNSRKNLKHFTSEYQPKNRPGRKPSKLRKYIKELNLSAKDVEYMVQYVMPLNQEQMMEKLKDDSVPVMIKVFIKALMSDLRNGSLGNTMKLLDRGFGKPKESVDFSGTLNNFNKNIDYSNLSEDEAKALFFQKLKGENEDE